MSTGVGPPLAGSFFDRAALYRSDDAWLAEAWTRARAVLISSRSATPVGADGRVRVFAATDAPDGPRRFLGLVDDVPYFSIGTEPDGGERWLTLREMGGVIDELDADLVVTAIGLAQWHQSHPRCARCGAATVETQAGWTRTCPEDSSQHFPRTDPAVIMLIHDGGDLALLGRGHQWGEGRFSTLAGFVEPGESVEAAVAREVYEEVGIAVRDVRYVASQPWPFPASLMLGFTGQLEGEPDIRLDPVEMAEAGWFSRDEIRRAADWTDDLATPIEGDASTRLRAIPPHFSISRYLIDEWLEGRI